MSASVLSSTVYPICVVPIICSRAIPVTGDLPSPFQLEDSERLKKRKERFGIVTPEDAKAKRAARFSSGAPVDPATEDKKKLRAARFGLA